ncbi:MAG: hypothetical protein DRJ63_09350 [Thermoprotei archaeon]|nr:MAG: hypothetical protein DRJ63_09350 [Thermoprotei archaeon]
MTILNTFKSLQGDILSGASMPYRRKSWREKLERKMEPKIVVCSTGKKKFVPTPMLIYSIVKNIPRGKLITDKLLREKLAEKYGADFTCPLATGWFIRIVAEYSEEEIKSGKKLSEVAPYWRILRSNGSLYEKFPGGPELQAERLKREGFELVKRGKKIFVKNYERYLWDIVI